MYNFNLLRIVIYCDSDLREAFVISKHKKGFASDRIYGWAIVDSAAHRRVTIAPTCRWLLWKAFVIESDTCN